MNINKATIAGVAVVVIASLFVPPVQAHRKYRPHHKGLPRRVLVRHSHDPSESTKSAVKTQAETKGFDPLRGAAGVVTGILKTLGKQAKLAKVKPAQSQIHPAHKH